jgi:hypothetical protein
MNEVTVGENKFYQINPTLAQLETLIAEDFFWGHELRKMK